MYLARRWFKGKPHYSIRESYQDTVSQLILSRDLFDLGENPASYIIYPGGNTFYIDDSIEEHLTAKGFDFQHEEIEELFWPFVKPAIREKLEPFISRSRHHKKSKKKGGRAKNALGPVHLFDKRRMYYLRCGVLDQCRIHRLQDNLFEPLSGKSRDEIEQYFMQMESMLGEHEVKEYVYVIFDLQRFFYEKATRFHPQSLDLDKLDEFFLQEICLLQKDSTFWAGMETTESLHEYLARYAIMFFDYYFGHSSFMDDYWREFISSKRFYKPPPAKSKVSMDEASELFGRAKDELAKMSKRALTRLYRQKAKKLHPDVGGEQEIFVKLTEAYNRLLQGKK